ncbi:MAG TPA: acetyl-CoA carboxylase biotin carboxyl carrier protein [Bryobacteraceae bacterium]|nr:acetyl-CoA carboxylase biotin carboxyl carrier protein [Bryobacteraceae bacterium]
MTNQEIKELLQIFSESDVAEMEVQRGTNRLRLRRTETVREIVVPASAPAAPPPASVSGHVGKPAAAESTDVLVKSPIVGTFYEAPTPGSAPFVKVGDPVEPGQVLCIIESMKLMNEIEAEVGGVVTAKLTENGRPVEYGEALFSIRPR